MAALAYVPPSKNGKATRFYALGTTRYSYIRCFETVTNAFRCFLLDSAANGAVVQRRQGLANTALTTSIAAELSRKQL